MGASSSNEGTSIVTEHPSESINRSENKENITLIWFDPDKKLNGDTTDLKKRLREINDYVIFHNELETCITYIQAVEKQKIILIIPDLYTSQILSSVAALSQVHSIFIYGSTKEHHLPLEDTKIAGIFDELDLLCSAIQEQITLADEQMYTWSFFDQEENATRDLSKQASDFLWLQLLHDVILSLPRDQQAKKQMIGACRVYYHGNCKELALIDEFEQKYQSKEAIQWYLKCSFLRKMINKALRTEDTNQLYILRYFLGDLMGSLARKHQQIAPSANEKLTVYREMKLSRDEFNKLKEKKGKLISLKGFLTARSHRSSTMPSATKEADYVTALFEIECNIQELGDSVSFADISQFNESSSSEEILFDLNTTFRLEGVQQDDGQLWLIKMNAVNDGRTITQKYIHDTRRQLEDLSIPIIFGKLVCDMSQWDQSQKYFEHLSMNPYGDRFSMDRT